MIKAISPILYNDVRYEAGEVLPELDEKVEKQLLATGSAELVTEPVFEEPKKPTKEIVGDQPNLKWSRTKLVGMARAKGLTADSTLTKEELLEMIEKAPELPPVSDSERMTPATTVNDNPAPQPDMNEIIKPKKKSKK
jgi:hypothetical protein